MKQKPSKKETVQISLLAVSVILIVFGLLFVVTASKIAPVFPAFYDIEHMLVQYIIVIITMASGIMLFSNVAATLENKKLKNGLTIGITAFSTVLTLPLLYVFLACFPAMNGMFGPVGDFMVKDIFADFQTIFTTEGAQIAIFIAGTLLSIVFLAVPLLTGVLTVRDKKLSIGKGGIKIVAKDAVSEENVCPEACLDAASLAADIGAEEEE